MGWHQHLCLPERLKAPCLCSSSTPATSHWHRMPPHDLSLWSPACHRSFHDFLPQFWAVIWLQTEPFDGREPKINCKGACLGLCFSPKPWLLFFLSALLTHICAWGGSGTYASQEGCPQFIPNLCTAKATAIKYPYVTQHLAQPWPDSAILSREER